MPHGEKHYGSRLTDAQVMEIRMLCASGTMSQKTIGSKFGISQTHVGRIQRGEGRKHTAITIPGAKKYYTRKLEEHQVLEIISLARSGQFMQSEIATRFGICNDQVSRISRGLIYRDIYKKAPLAQVGPLQETGY